MTERLNFLDFVASADAEASGSAKRARDAEHAVERLEPRGPWLVAFEDGDDVHEVVLFRDGDDWHGDCWHLDDTGDRHERCRGLNYSDGPCAHLFAVRRAVEPADVLDAAEERADHHVERLRADGGQRWDR